MGSALKAAALIICAIALSILLGMLAFDLPWATPGAYLVYWMFPPGGSGQYSPGPVLLVHIGTDSLLCFAALSGLYLLFANLFNR